MIVDQAEHILVIPINEWVISQYEFDLSYNFSGDITLKTF